MKIGDKVRIPTTKSVGVSWGNSIVIKTALDKGQSYLYLTEVEEDVCFLSTKEEGFGYEQFLLSELEKYNENLPLEVIIELRKVYEEINTTNKKSLSKGKERK